jgi:Reverse transcriptase (RNA-dependent DNA polymerase)
LFDNIVLSRYADHLSYSKLQFGFKAKSSTNLCSMVLTESLAYYINNQSSVFCTFLDATKVFDRVRHCKMFNLLMSRQLPAIIIRLLINFYIGNYVRVQWGGIVSDNFLAIHGMKQGGDLSPVLFCLYIDGLLEALSKAGVRCFIGDNFVGALAYADGIVLLAPTASALRSMLVICDKYASDYAIVFNASKSKCLVVLPRSRRFLYDYLRQCTFYIGNNPIDYVDSFVHLGHIISQQLTDNDDILQRRNAFVGQVNDVLCYFRKLKPDVKYRLFKAYCMSMYGCEFLLLSNGYLNDLCVSWRKILRRIWGLPLNSHNCLPPLIGRCLPLADEICSRSLNFINACLRNNSGLVRNIAHYGIQYGRYNSLIVVIV